MNIELSSGKISSNVSNDVLKEKLQLLKSGEDFLILNDGENYIQCASSGSGSSLVFEYQDSTGHYSSSSDITFDKGEELLDLYLNRDNSWKNLTEWEAGEGYENTKSSAPSGDSAYSAGFSSGAGTSETGDNPLSVGGLLNTLKKTAKKEVKRAVEKKTSGLVKDVFKKFMK